MNPQQLRIGVHGDLMSHKDIADAPSCDAQKCRATKSSDEAEDEEDGVKAHISGSVNNAAALASDFTLTPEGVQSSFAAWYAKCLHLRDLELSSFLAILDTSCS